jgi:hypothetical protein
MTEKYVFAPNADEGFIPLSRSKSGRLVRKQILKTGPLNYPGVKGGKVELTNDMFDKIVENFNEKVCDIVQFPMADNNNAHSEDPLRNAGEVVQLQHEGDSLYAYIDVRKPEVMEGIANKTVIGASAMLALNYTDTRTGKAAGPTLLHVAGTNRPHVLELDDFEVIAASVDSKGEAVLLSAPTDNKETPHMETLTEIFDHLKAEHNIDVPALQASVAENAGVAELSAKISDALQNTGVIKLSNGESAKAEDLVLAVGQLAEDKVELSNRVEALELSNKRIAAEAEVDKLIEDGFIAESTRAAFVDLKLSNEETFKALVPEQPIIKLSGEPHAFVPADAKPDDVVAAEIDRYVGLSAK